MRQWLTFRFIGICERNPRRSISQLIKLERKALVRLNASAKRLSRGARKRRRRKPKVRPTSLEIGEALLEKQAVHVSDVSVSHSAGEEKPIIAVGEHGLAVECGPVKGPAVKTATTNAVVSPQQAKEKLPEPTEDCAMPDDYTEPAIPQTQVECLKQKDKRCQPRTEKPDFRTVTPVTKIGSSFEELRNYKIPKIKRPVPPTKEHGSRVSRTYPVSPVSKKRREKQDEHREELSSSPSSSPAVSTSSSNVLLDKIIEDMNKAYPKVSGCYVSCRDSCPHRNQVHEFPKSPAKCPLEDNQELSKSAILDCAPVSNHIGQKHQMKVCTVCKRKNVSEGLGQDTCIRCSLYEQINKEQAAVKEHGSKERQAVRKPDVPAKVQARRSSSDVENKELVTRTPTSPRSRSKSKSRTSNTDNVSTASPQANEHNNVLRKRRRKTYLTKQIISSSDDSCTSEDDICAAAASAVPASQDGANSLQYRQPRPQRKCRALSESPQNVTEEPAQKDDSQDPEEPLTTVSLVDAVFGTPKASIGTIDRGCAGRGGRLYQMLEEYVQNVERFLAALHQCTPGYRDRLVSTLLPEGIVGLKRIVQLVWRMEAELQCLGRDRVSDLDKGVFSLLMEHTGNLSKTTAEQDLPTFMSFQVHIEPQLQTLADPLCQEVADDGQHTNCIITAVRRPSDSLSEKGEMAGQPKSPQATTVDGAVRGTAHTTATVDASRLEQGQQSTGMSCPPRAASGILKNDVLYDAVIKNPVIREKDHYQKKVPVKVLASNLHYIHKKIACPRP
ncbi:hypothetical protein HPB52_008185 [Rhipicephalus sanguineus]|uniref:Uncharacterized protein n=1 Tax=Rhipicephalus sanguineus TaxID=34632 RepID=A0A9D4SY33_RHISA|nr:hypothetical protein HPB52_008185 [Rhipicephalus sanguineus]